MKFGDLGKVSLRCLHKLPVGVNLYTNKSLCYEGRLVCVFFCSCVFCVFFLGLSFFFLF